MTVDDDECSNNTLPPLEQVSCIVQCSSDCVLSAWSEWTPCLHQGRRRRTRYIIGLPLADSDPCPTDLMEEEVCSAEQQMEQLHRPIFGWWPLPWGPCRMSDDSSCGMGVHKREVRCTRDDGQHVDDVNCAMLSRPDSVRSCTIPCSEECRLSDWSEWSQCSDQSQDDAIQSRIRVILQQPAVSTGSSSSFACPPLIEKRSCFDWLVQQERIGWRVSAWSACHLSHNAICGTGISIRSTKLKHFTHFLVYYIDWLSKKKNRQYFLLSKVYRAGFSVERVLYQIVVSSPDDNGMESVQLLSLFVIA